MSARKMVITRTPHRITFVGGGTDLASFYVEHGPGACVSAAINKYMYVIVNKKFDDKIKVGYSKTELVDSASDVEHTIIRESLKKLNIHNGIEISIVSDIPAGGTGLGSSSTLAVGLLHALHAWKGEAVTQQQLAEEAVDIEINTLHEPIGQQDQYAAAYGGMQFMKFNRDGSVDVHPIIMRDERYRSFHNHLLLLYTGKQRSASEILMSQSQQIGNHVESYNKMARLAFDYHTALSEGRWLETGKFLHENWQLKKTLAANITDKEIEEAYQKALQAGAHGGKLIGAGGGGFLLFFAPPEKREDVKAVLGLREESFRFEAHGSQVVYASD